MAAQFDATARINVDLRGFANAANQVTGAGGTMNKVFQNLGQQLTSLERVSKKQAEALTRTISLYTKLASVTQQYASVITSLSGKSRQVNSGIQNMTKIFGSLQAEMGKVTKSTATQSAAQQRQLKLFQQVAQIAVQYANAIKTLSQSEEASARGAKAMEQAFSKLKSILSEVRGMSADEAARLNRTLQLYSQLAQVLTQVARAYQIIRQTGQADEKLAQSAQRNVIAQQRLATEQERNAQAAKRNELATQRLAQEQQRLELQAQRAAAAQQRLATESDRAANSMGRFNQSSFAVRSSLSEITQTGEQMLQVFQQVGTVMLGTAISQEQAFAQVSRVVGETEAETHNLLAAFRQISEEFPISFEEVARIGQLGAQIGVTADQLDSFTRTVAKFSITTGVSVDQATLLLGRIAEMQDVPISQMENLGSAILALGTASAATEDEILRINESIATVSNVFGLTAQATTGLAAALATLRVRPELSRGSLTRVFGELDEAISGGSDALTKLSEVMGMTAVEVVNLRNSNPDEFFLAFVRGLDTAAGETNNFQQVIRSLGINAVRDIDTFTRLANNVNVLEEAFARSNDEWRRGTELQRQSEGIFKTTANEIQNLFDALKNTAAQAMGPLATAIGFVATNLTTLVDLFNKLGPVLPIIAGIATAVAVGGAAWVAYQVVLAKTIRSMIAMKELQRTLGVQNVTAGTALAVYRGELAGTGVAATTTAQSLKGLSTSAQAAAIAVGQAATANAGYARSSATMALSTANIANNLRTTAQATAAASLANQNYAMTTTQMAAANTAAANAMLRAGGQMSIMAGIQNTAVTGAARYNQTLIQTTTAQAGLNRTSAMLVPTLTTLNTRMYQAVQAGNAMGAGMALTATRMAQLQTSAVAVSSATQRAGLAARAAAFAFGPWGLAIGVLALAMGPLIGEMLDFSSASDKIAAKAVEAAGGTNALTTAIKADTDAAIKAAGSRKALSDAIASGNQETLESLGVYRAVTAETSDISDANQKAVRTTIERAQAEKRAILLTQSSVDQLRKQAQGHDAAAQSAQGYLDQLERADETIDNANKALAENTAILGPNAQAWLQATAEAAASSSKIADGSDLSQRALKALGDTGVNVGQILQDSLKRPEVASKALDDAINQLGKTSDNYALGGGKIADSINEQASASLRAKTFLEALRTTVSKTSDEQTKAATINQLLGASLTQVGEASSLVRGSVEITAAELEEMGSSSEEAGKKVDGFVKSLEGFGTPLDAFTKAAETHFNTLSEKAREGETAIGHFALTSKDHLAGFLAELDKIAEAQRNWAANLVKISATLGADIAQGLADLGPQAAPMLQELANLTTGELEKLKPRLQALGAGSIESLAAGLLQGQAQLTNVSSQTANFIASTLSTQLGNAKNTQQFLDVINRYGVLVESLKAHKGEVSISNTAALKSIDDIINYIKLSEDARLFDPDGRALLKSELFTRGAFDLLDLVLRLEKEGAFDPNGKAKLDPSSFDKSLDGLQGDVSGAESDGSLDPKGDARLNTYQYNKDLRLAMQAAYSAADYISTTMSTSATVRVGYYYYQKNSPPSAPSTQAIKDGGWVHGPGGPRDDKVPAMLSNGEFVINAKQAARYGSLLQAINSGRAGRGYSTGMSAMGGVGPQMQPVTIASADLNKAMQKALIQRIPTEAAIAKQLTLPQSSSGPVINITNQYPQAEPTSVTINRSLAFAATISGVS